MTAVRPVAQSLCRCRLALCRDPPHLRCHREYSSLMCHPHARDGDRCTHASAAHARRCDCEQPAALASPVHGVIDAFGANGHGCVAPQMHRRRLTCRTPSDACTHHKHEYVTNARECTGAVRCRRRVRSRSTRVQSVRRHGATRRILVAYLAAQKKDKHLINQVLVAPDCGCSWLPRAGVSMPQPRNVSRLSKNLQGHCLPLISAS